MRKVVDIPELARRIGESHHRAKLTDHDVDLILALADEGLKHSVIADKFDVTRRCISFIVAGDRRGYRSAQVIRMRTTTDRGDRS